MQRTSQQVAPTPRYAWVIVGCGMLVLFSCLGLARFAFGILLPPMAEALELSYAQRGYLGTGCFIGYLFMVALTPALARRVGHRNTVGLGLALIAATMLLIGVVGGYESTLALYSLTGVGSGAANVAMMALITAWFPREKRGSAAGLVIVGNGVAIIYSGYMVPMVVQAAGQDGWRAGWILLGVLSAFVCVLTWALLRNAPQSTSATPGESAPAPDNGAAPISPAQRKELFHLGSIYFLFGLTYIVYATFIVTTLVDERAMGEDAAGRFWAWVGFFSLVSGPLFGRISDVTSRRVGLIATYAVQTAAYALAALNQDAWGVWPLYASICLFGVSVWSIPTIMTAAVADRVGARLTASGFAFITFFFATGQLIGPTAAGWLADATGGFTAAFAACACCTLLAAALSFPLGKGRA